MLRGMVSNIDFPGMSYNWRMLHFSQVEKALKTVIKGTEEKEFNSGKKEINMAENKASKTAENTQIKNNKNDSALKGISQELLNKVIVLQGLPTCFLETAIHSCNVCLSWKIHSLYSRSLSEGRTGGITNQNVIYTSSCRWWGCITLYIMPSWILIF